MIIILTNRNNLRFHQVSISFIFVSSRSKGVVQDVFLGLNVRKCKNKNVCKHWTFSHHGSPHKTLTIHSHNNYLKDNTDDIT